MSEKEELIKELNKKINYVLEMASIEDLKELLKQINKTIKIVKKIEEMENKYE